MATVVTNSKRHLRRASGLAWLAIALALLQPYDRPPERWVQSDSGDWFQLSELAGWLCLPGGSNSPGGETPHGVDPFCGLCIVGGVLVADLPEGTLVTKPSQYGAQGSFHAAALNSTGRSGERPPVRGPPYFVRLS